MIKIEGKIISRSNFDKLLQGLRDIRGYIAVVGIPEERSSRSDEEVNNAELLYIHTNGSPIRRIPARPVIEPAIEERGTKEKILEELKAAGKDALLSKMVEARKHLMIAGQIGENAAKAWFTDPRNGWPPNSPATIKQKLEKLSGKRKEKALSAFASGFSSYTWQGREFYLDTPLIDTGVMRKSITHQVLTSEEVNNFNPVDRLIRETVQREKGFAIDLVESKSK